MINKLKGFPLSLEQKEELLNIIKEVAGNGSGDNKNALNINVLEVDGQMAFIANDKMYDLLGRDVDVWDVNSIELYQYLLDNEIKAMIWNMDIPTDTAEDNAIMISNSVAYVKCKDYIMFVFVIEGRFITVFINNKDSI